jgi:alanine-synthesizing transaminase
MGKQAAKGEGVHFAQRTGWDFEENELARACRELKAAGVPVTDLTVSNPTKCALDYGALDVGHSFEAREILDYSPDPWGLPGAREAVARFYADMGIAVPVGRIMLTSSTSEGYNYVFRLLCDPEDGVLAPAPSYPLFQFLADVNDVRIASYPLVYEDGAWRIDREGFLAALTNKMRAVIVVSPNNPTGSYLREGDMRFIYEVAAERGLAIICDEVFADYSLEPRSDAVRTLVGRGDGPLTFVLSGLSKILAMPQMKLSWIAIGGAADVVMQASQRLEMIADTFLSVNTPVQTACAAWLAKRSALQGPVLERLRGNLRLAREMAAPCDGLELLHAEGGWYAVVSMDGMKDEDAFAVSLARERHVIAHPGYYYDFAEGAHVVLSLLTEPTAWSKGLDALVQHYKAMR